MSVWEECLQAMLRYAMHFCSVLWKPWFLTLSTLVDGAYLLSTTSRIALNDIISLRFARSPIPGMSATMEYQLVETRVSRPCHRAARPLRCLPCPLPHCRQCHHV